MSPAVALVCLTVPSRYESCVTSHSTGNMRAAADAAQRGGRKEPCLFGSAPAAGLRWEVATGQGSTFTLRDSDAQPETRCTTQRVTAGCVCKRVRACVAGKVGVGMILRQAGGEVVVNLVKKLASGGAAE